MTITLSTRKRLSRDDKLNFSTSHTLSLSVSPCLPLSLSLSLCWAYCLIQLGSSSRNAWLFSISKNEIGIKEHFAGKQEEGEREAKWEAQRADRIEDIPITIWRWRCNSWTVIGGASINSGPEPKRRPRTEMDPKDCWDRVDDGDWRATSSRPEPNPTAR